MRIVNLINREHTGKFVRFLVLYWVIVLSFFSCQKSPPPVPILQSPDNLNWFWYTNSLHIEFKWSISNNDKCVLEIDDDEDFESPLLSVDIIGTNYTWTPSRGRFYWRVYPEGCPESSSDTFNFEVGPYTISKYSTGGEDNIPCITSPYIYGGEIYLLLGCENGLWIINAGIFGTNPYLVTNIATTDVVSDIDTKDHYAFIAAGTDGLKIIDIENPSNPQVIGKVAIPGYYGVTSVKISPYAYDWNVYAGSDDGLYVVDCSILSQPQIIANIPSDSIGFVNDISVYGDYVFTASNIWGYGNQGLYAIDISNPYHPRKIAYHYSEGTGMAVYSDHGKIWFTSSHKLEILNTLPLFQLLGEFELEHLPMDGSISLSFPSEIVFIGTYKGLEIIDATDPGNCFKISSIEFPYITTSASTLTGSDLGFLTNTIDGLYIIKVLTMNY